jgi:membrane fusion protein (multidrug efflux system)
MAKGTNKRMIIMLLIVALVFGAIYGFQLFRNSMIQKAIKGKGIPPLQRWAARFASAPPW